MSCDAKSSRSIRGARRKAGGQSEFTSSCWRERMDIDMHDIAASTSSQCSQYNMLRAVHPPHSRPYRFEVPVHRIWSALLCPRSLHSTHRFLRHSAHTTVFICHTMYLFTQGSCYNYNTTGSIPCSRLLRSHIASLLAILTFVVLAIPPCPSPLILP